MPVRLPREYHLVGTVVSNAPTCSLVADIFLKNGKEAQALNTQFLSINNSDICDGVRTT